LHSDLNSNNEANNLKANLIFNNFEDRKNFINNDNINKSPTDSLHEDEDYKKKYIYDK